MGKRHTLSTAIHARAGCVLASLNVVGHDHHILRGVDVGEVGLRCGVIATLSALYCAVGDIASLSTSYCVGGHCSPFPRHTARRGSLPPSVCRTAGTPSPGWTAGRCPFLRFEVGLRWCRRGKAKPLLGAGEVAAIPCLDRHCVSVSPLRS